MSRLERLSQLLHTGSNSVVRQTAADQLGDIVRQRPEDFPHVIEQIHRILRQHYRNWDTRVAIGKAFESIALVVPPFHSTDAGTVAIFILRYNSTHFKVLLIVPDGASRDLMALDSQDDLLKSSQFSVSDVLAKGDPLLASSGEEFTIPTDIDPKLQRKMLQQRMGFNLAGVDAVDDSDFVQANHVTERVAQANISDQIGLSAREKAMLRRKRRQPDAGTAATQNLASIPTLRDLDTISDRLDEIYQAVGGKDKVRAVTVLPEYNMNITSDFSSTATNQILMETCVNGRSIYWNSLNAWPFGALFDRLVIDLFDPGWETRHAAALILREIIRLHASSAGLANLIAVTDGQFKHICEKLGYVANENCETACAKAVIAYIQQTRNNRYLEDLAVRLLCIFALDRFNDFVGDQAVAPVRETCGQLFGFVVRSLGDQSALKSLIIGGLLQLDNQNNLPHSVDIHSATRVLSALKFSAMIGLKYFMAAQKEAASFFLGLPGLKEALLQRLQDPEDDVRSLAAAALLPVLETFVTLETDSLLLCLISSLLESLSEMDDLSSGIANIMSLLSALLQMPSVVELYIKSDIGSISSGILGRLFPFCRHTISTVRLSVMKTIDSLLSVLFTSHETSHEWIGILFEHLVQNLLLESDELVRDQTRNVWYKLWSQPIVPSVIGDHLLSNSLFSQLFNLISAPVGSFMNINCLPISSDNNSGSNLSPGDKAMVEQDLEVFSRDFILHIRFETVELLVSSLGENINLINNEAFWNVFGVTICTTVPHDLPVWQLTAVISSKAITAFSNAVSKSNGHISAISSPGLPKFASNMLKLFFDRLHHVLFEDSSTIQLLDTMGQMMKLEADTKGLLHSLLDAGNLSHSVLPPIPDTLSLEDIQVIIEQWCPPLLNTHLPAAFQNLNRPPKSGANYFTELHQTLINRVASLSSDFQLFLIASQSSQSTVMAACAAAIISVGGFLPQEVGDKPRFNPILRNLMNGVKIERNPDIQKMLCNAVGRMIALLLSENREPLKDLCGKVAAKIVRNCCAFVCSLPTETFLASDLKWKEKSDNAICRLDRDELEQSDDSLEVIRNNGAMILAELSALFQSKLFSEVPAILEVVEEGLLAADLSSEALEVAWDQQAQPLLNSLQILKVLVSFLPADLLNSHFCSRYGYLKRVVKLVNSPWTAIRYMSSSFFAQLLQRCNQLTSTPIKFEISPMLILIEEILPLLSDPISPCNRVAAAELIWLVLEKLDMHILPYLVFFLVPILGRMSDQHDHVRQTVTNSFSRLVRLMPLEADAPDPRDLPFELLQRKQQERSFITQLLDTSKLENFELPVAINATLRKYQQDGLNWLAFLNKYQLHGILCDDMGLGKTLQTICMIASDHHHRSERFRLTKSPNSRPLPSLVVCPTSLTGHWKHEIEQFSQNLRPIIYGGLVAERARLRQQICNYDVIVASYDVIRNDIDYIVAEMDFNYCVLDEGHIIKNAKSKMTMAVKQIRANHRLILSGTPIQNNVLELWSLFDFLMPGFLGTERQFNDRFSKPILAMKGKYIGSGGGSSGKKINPAAAAKIQEAGTLALEALHRQVLPFLLRRVKEQVMDDLPPKIIQDYYCEMSDLQRMIYNDFVRNQAAALGIADLEASGEKKGGGAGHHIFQALQYMRKVCNHPALVMTDPQDPLYADVQQQCERQKMNLRDVRHSPKLLALKDLLQNCGIGVAGAESKPDDGAASSAEDAITTATVSQHRALIFCQLRPMVEFIEQDLFKNHMPDVSYLRLDGSTSPSDRHNIAQRFNSDPSIDVLLLTTNVGGLGLNLTGADTVIFVEHDWNPMKDLQAMDRAHRIGQKRVVNVYRLITKDTLEEKIMGLQRFKLNIANTVISEENSGGGFKSMRSEEILDLFGSSASTAAEASGRKRSRQAGDDEVEAGLKRAKVGGVAGLSQDIMEQLDLLTAQSAEQYESELDFNKFMERLHGK